MKPFTTFTAIAAPIEIADVDTDMLFPAAFLKTVSRQGLAQALFHNLRQDQPEFPLDTSPWDKAGILVALDNFGCGSSREHAPWALLDFGIRCIIAPSFADIFRGNCFKNGILPIVLDRSWIDLLLADARDPATASMTVDLQAQKVVRQSGEAIAFDIDQDLRLRLLEGIDDVTMSLAHADAIFAYEWHAREWNPWLRPIPEPLP